MHYYRGTFEYDGTGFCGFQWQKDLCTIQDELNQSIKSMVEGTFSTMGASRTDSGVHALRQVVKITSQRPIDCQQLLKHFNSTLSSQIRCLDLNPCAGGFNPAAAPYSKVYHYFFTNERQLARNQQRFISNISNPLNLATMQNCVDQLTGIHDFKNFCSLGSNVKTTVREIFFCELDLGGPQSLISESGVFHLADPPVPIFCLRIEGKGFLKQMIRHLVSALWMVGSGKLSEEEFVRLLKGVEKKEKRLWRVAPPNGLFLVDFKD